jgi:hypothetical protein
VAESTLTLTRSNYQDDIAEWIGWGRVLYLSNATHLAAVQRMFDIGLRQLVYPPPVTAANGQIIKQSHVWSWLRAGEIDNANLSHTTRINVAINDFQFLMTANLDQEFGGIISGASFLAGSTVLPLDIINEDVMNAMRGAPETASTTGTPKYIAVFTEAYSNAGAQSLRHRIVIHPTSDVDGSLVLRFVRHPANVLTDIYPDITTQHSETLRASCLAAAERFKNDEKGVQWDYFMERLGASIAFDEQLLIERGRQVTWLTSGETTTLDLQYNDLALRAGGYWDYGFNPAVWGETVKRQIDAYVQDGYRMFLRAWEWSFLKVQAQIGLTSGATHYNLPDDFAGIIGDKITFDTSDEQNLSIQIVHENVLRATESRGSFLGRPRYACLQIRTGTPLGGTLGQLWELRFFPAPNATYQVNYRYLQRPPKLNGTTNTAPVGGFLHSDAIMAAVLATCELAKTKQKGHYWQEWETKRDQSIEIDKRSEADSAEIWPDELVSDDTDATADTSSAPGFRFSNLFRDVGVRMGLGPNRRQWGHDKTKMVDRRIQTGYAKFIHPQIIVGLAPVTHRWSFLTQFGTITTVPYQYNLDAMPVGFGTVLGPMTFDSEDGFGSIDVVDPNRIEELQSGAINETGVPRLVAFRSVITNEAGINQFADSHQEAIFWPTPDAAYVIRFQYEVQPFPLTDLFVVPFGSPIHADTIMYSCFAVVEMEDFGIVNGPMRQEFERCLAKSISYDQTATTSQTLGFMADHSDDLYEQRGGSWRINRHECRTNDVEVILD